MRLPGISKLIIGLMAMLLAGAAVASADLAALTEGVAAIASPGAPGSLALVSEDAFPVVLGGSGRDLHEPVVAAAECGRGRVVAFGHGGYLNTSGHDTATLVRNAIRWTARRQGGEPGRPIRLGWMGPGRHLPAPIAEGLDFTGSKPRDVTALRDLDVLVLHAQGHDEQWARGIATWVRSGGGLVVAATGWGWQQLNPGLDLAGEGPMNRLGVELGIMWTNTTVKDTGKDRFVIEPFDPELFNAATLMAALADAPETIGARSGNEAKQIERTLQQAVRWTDPRRGPLRKSLDQLRRREADPIVPTPQRPLTADQVVPRIMLMLQLELEKAAEPREVKAHPAAEAFPGLPEPGASAVSREVVVDLAVPRWQTTGLYAPPGAVITIEIGGGDLPAGLKVRVGCHKDWLGRKDRWKRAPDVTMVRDVKGPRTMIASPFGGLVYLVVPKKLAPGTMDLTIRGAIPAPTYVHGQTDLEQWRRTERLQPAPWGELVSDRVILSLPATVLRDLDRPDEVMEVWNAVLDACAELAGIPMERPSPERIVTDVQISAGYMHSGYPIMTHLDVAGKLASVEALRSGVWGIYHELGHNHQRRDWTFSGTGEVTCNLFSLYVYDRVCGKDLDSDGLHGGIVPARRAERIASHYGPGKADFQAWRRDPFLALTMYVQLAEAFGWESYREVFATYRDLPADQRPRSDEQSRDQWMERFSRQVGRNLAPFFDGWGIPISDEARARVADLPPWTPASGAVVPDQDDAS